MNYNFLKKHSFEFYLCIIWLISILIVNPIGEFPLNDDWAFAQSVWDLHNKGELIINEWPAMTLIGQVYWGTFFCKLFSLSFFTLRFCTLVTALLGIITFFRITKLLNINSRIGFLATLLLLFNPLFFSLSFTFMTDVHFLSFMLFSIFFFLKYFQSQKIIYLLFATLFSIIATLIRQPGVIVPLSFFLFTLLKKKDNKGLILSALSFVMTIGSLLIFNKFSYLFLESEGKVAGIGSFMEGLKAISMNQFFTRIAFAFLYLGLFLFPLIFLFINELKFYFLASKVRIIIWSCISLILFFLIHRCVYYPTGNTFFNLGLGPKLLKDGYWGDNISPILNEKIWSITLKLLSVLGLICFSIIMLKHFKFKEIFTFRWLKIGNTNLFLAILFIGYLSLLVINLSFFDRYIIPLVGIFLLLIIQSVSGVNRMQKYLVIFSLCIMTSFSIFATHDYLSWNRARWEAADYLMKNLNIPPTEIDGGFEFNSWYKTGEIGKPIPNTKSFWGVKNDSYVISFGAVNGYKAYKSIRFHQYLPIKQNSIYILKK